MNNIIQQAAELRAKAISLLLTERDAIDTELEKLGHDGTPPRVKHCKVCGQEGHTARRHKNGPVETEP